MMLAASDITYVCMDLVGDAMRPAAFSTFLGDLREFIWDSSLPLLSMTDWPKVAAEFHWRWSLNGSWR